MPNGDPTFWLIAGPNGVGKTTYAMRHLKAVSGSVNFVNLDEIARGLSPLDPSVAQTDAARIALSRARNFIEGRRTFAMETTLSGLAHLRLLEAARDAGMGTAMLYFSVISPDICLERIARRVAEGGHDVAEPIVRRRFDRSARNLPRYVARCDLWRVYEASGARPRLALEGKRGGVLTYRDDQALSGGHAGLHDLAAPP
jgi:predicted ABC-type ATPase